MNGIIYKATNNINNKIYIGKTIQKLSRRKIKHESDAFKNNYNSFFHNAIRKYGFKNFTWEILTESNSESKLNALEKFYIAIYRKMGEVYNITNGGDGMSGYKHNLEFRIKMSKKMKGRAFSEKTLKKMSLAKQNMSSETRLKIAKSKIGKIPWNKGGTHSETTRKKLSESHKGCIPWNKGGTHSDETKKKISISKIGFKPSRESVNRGRIKRIGQKRTEETKKKMSEARKLYYAKQNKATPDQILGITHTTVIENMQKQTIRKKIK